jgi:rubrerythrin
MSEIMIRFNDLRRYCEKRHVGSVPIEYIKQMKTIEAEPVRHGRWIPTEYDSYADGNPVYDAFECSECGHEHSGEEDTLTAFCPDCGADMRELSEDAGTD